MSVATSQPNLAAAVVLEDIDWATYETLRGLDANRNLRMTYDAGTLILMSPSKLHERVAELLARLIGAWTEEWMLPCQSAGSTTLKRQLLQRGFETDKCFYLQHEAEVRGKDAFDPDVDPPPDLSIEVDVTSQSTSRLSIFAAFGIPEVWRWREERLSVYVLRGDQYVASEQSSCLPGFPLPEAAHLLSRRLETDETTLVREFRRLVRSRRTSQR